MIRWNFVKVLSGILFGAALFSQEALARERVSLEKAMTVSNYEKFDSERHFHAKSLQQSRDQAESQHVRAIRVDIGDELGGSGESSDATIDYAATSRATKTTSETTAGATDQNLKQEWKEVTRAFRPHIERAKPAGVEASAGGSSVSTLPSARAQKSARAANDDGLQ